MLVEDESELPDASLLAPCSSASSASWAVLPDALALEEELSLFNSASTASCAELPLLDVLVCEFNSCNRTEIASAAVSPELDDVVELSDVLEAEVDDDVDVLSDEDAVDADDVSESPVPQLSVGGGPGGGPGGCGISCESSSLNCCSLTLPVLLGSSLA